MLDTATQPRLLFLISNDFGELSTAVSFVHGTSLGALLLLPDRLCRVNDTHLPVPHGPYRSVADVLQAVEQYRPNIVFLFSGYLFAVNGIFECQAFAGLVARLQQDGVLVVTSDPFLGLLWQVDASTVNNRLPDEIRLPLADVFAKMSDVLHAITHIYQVSAEEVGRDNSVSFFNPNMVQSLAGEESQRAGQARLIDRAARKWLFVLSAEDHGVQVALHGHLAFHTVLLDRLKDAVCAGCQPVLLAPEPCLAALRESATAIPGAILLSFCPFDLFHALLLDAEYVFYWNIFSNSIILRVVNGLPLFSFNRGHLAPVVTGLAEKGLRCYYQGASPPYLDQRRPLSLDTLAPLALQQEQTLTVAREALCQGTHPEALVKSLLENRGLLQKQQSS